MKTIDLQPLMCKASDALYRQYLAKQYGLGSCQDDEDIENLLENIKLLKYVSKNKFCGCDKEQLIENLK